VIVAVTDTHPLLWYVSGRSDRLGPRAREAFEGADRSDGSALIYIPTIVLTECLAVIENNRIRIEERFDVWVRQLDRHAYFALAELRSSTILKCFELPMIPDPFDRMIVATALDLELPLMSVDQEIQEINRVELLWE
jgi:PIN domain nuclease of toxin-antitoxin system